MKIRTFLPVLAVLAIATGASASTVTFGDFDNFGADNLSFTDTGSGGTLTGSIPVEFKFEDITGGDPYSGAYEDATMTFDFSTSSTAVSVGNTLIEGGFTGTFSITLGATDLLSGTIVTPGATLSGTAGGSSATFSDSTPPPGAVSFSSNVISFPDPISQGFSFSLTSANPFFGADNSGNYVASFSSAVSGTFDSNPPPTATPEPASMLLLGAGLIAFGSFGMRRMRNRR
jgi:hypothetical protein